MQDSHTHIVKILLVDDDEDDQFMLKKIFKKLLPSAEIVQLFNGAECLAYLENCDENRPALITMDLNMPLVTGAEAMEKIRSDERFKDIVTVMLSTSDRENEKRLAMDSGANDYFAKPVEYDKLIEIVKSIIDKWL